MKNLRFIFSCLVACAVPSLSAQVHPVQFNLGSVNVGSSISSVVTIPLTAQGTIAKVTATTGGAENLDFINPGGSISVTCNPGNSFGAVLIPCTANVKFQPRYAGARYGSIAVWGTNGQLMGAVYLQGTGLAPQTSFQPATQIQPASHTQDLYYNPQAVTTDESGNVYAMEGIFSFTRSGPPTSGYITKNSTTFANLSPGSNPDALAFDGAGSFYLDQPNSNKFAQQSDGTYAFGVTVPFTGHGAVDGGGNLYVSCAAGICKETLQSDGSYLESTIASGLTPAGIAVDGNGDVFVADGPVYQLSPSGSGYTQSTITSGISAASAVALDGVGNVYVNDSAGKIYKETLQPDGSYTQSLLVNGSVTSGRLAVDPLGNTSFFESTGPGIFGYASWQVFGTNYSTPPTLTFANTTQGSSSSAQVVTITNSGNLPLQLSAIDYPADFPQAGTPVGDCTAGTSLEPNASCTLTINFTPVTPISGASGVLTEQVLITSNIGNAPGTQQAITVTGTENARVATPTVSLPAGVYYTTQAVTLSDTTPGAKIYYTLNGSTPTTSSMLAKGPIGIKSAETLKAIAVAPGYATSPMISAYYALTASTPVISPAGGTFTGPQTVTITTATPIEFIFYTTGNTFPTTSSPRYTGPITVSSSENVIAFAFQTGFLASPIVRQKFVITAPPESVTK